MKSFYNIHNLTKIAVETTSPNFEEHRHYLRFFSTPSLLGVDRVVSSEVYEPTLPPIQKILSTHGMTFVHSLGLEINGRGVILPASGGVGKTSLISHLRQTLGVRFFGDDFVILGQDSTMLSFPSDFSIYPYHLDLFPEIKGMKEGAFLKRRKYLFWFYFIRRAINYIAKRLKVFPTPLFSGWNAEYVKVPAEALVAKEKIGDKTKVSISIFLERYMGMEVEKEEISSTETVEKVLEILQKELKLASVEKERVILTDAFSKIKCYVVRIPKMLSSEKYFAFMDKLLKNI